MKIAGRWQNKQVYESWQSEYGSNLAYKGDCWNLGACVPDNPETQASFCCGGDDINNNMTAKRLPNGTLQIFVFPTRSVSIGMLLTMRYYKKQGASLTSASCEDYLDATGYDTCCRTASCFRGTCPTWKDGAKYGPQNNAEAPWVEKFSEGSFRDQASVHPICVKEKKHGDVCEGFSLDRKSVV